MCARERQPESQAPYPHTETDSERRRERQGRETQRVTRAISIGRGVEADAKSRATGL